MEIDVTAFVKGETPRRYSASAAELGPDAGRKTWRAAMTRAAVEPPMLDSEDKLDALREHMRGYGAWSAEEIAGWSAQECEAMLVQEIAADMRDYGWSAGTTREDYEATCAKRDGGGRLYMGDNGRWYIYLSR